MTIDDDRTGLVQQELSKDEIEKRGAKLASEELEREKLLEKKRSSNRLWNEELKQIDVRISVLAAEVNSGMAWVPAQSGLFDEDTGEVVDEVPPPGGRRRRSRRNAESVGDAA